MPPTACDRADAGSPALVQTQLPGDPLPQILKYRLTRTEDLRGKLLDCEPSQVDGSLFRPKSVSDCAVVSTTTACTTSLLA